MADTPQEVLDASSDNSVTVYICAECHVHLVLRSDEGISNFPFTSVEALDLAKALFKASLIAKNCKPEGAVCH